MVNSGPSTEARGQGPLTAAWGGAHLLDFSQRKVQHVRYVMPILKRSLAQHTVSAPCAQADALISEQRLIIGFAKRR